MNNRNTSCRAVCEENKKNAVMITTDLPAGPLRSGPARLSRAFSRRDGQTSTHIHTHVHAQVHAYKHKHTNTYTLCVYNTRRQTHTGKHTHTHAHAQANTHAHAHVTRRSNLLFFLNLWRKSTTPPAPHIPWRFLLLYVMRINHDVIADDDERENSRGSGFATGAESASSVAKRFCTGLTMMHKLDVKSWVTEQHYTYHTDDVYIFTLQNMPALQSGAIRLVLISHEYNAYIHAT